MRRVSAASVTAVCDLEIARARTVASEFEIGRVFDDPAQVLALTDIDAVGVLSSPESPPRLAVGALASRLPVYVEKPLALTSDACRRIISAAETANLPAFTGFHMRFHRLVRQARDIVRQGALGTIESIRLVWHSPRGDAGISGWKSHRQRGGGALIEIGVHHLDLVRFLLQDEFSAIHAITRDQVREDECAVIVAKTTRDVLVSAEFSERSPHEIEFTVSGTNGLLRVDCLRFDGLELRRGRDVAGAPAVRLRNLVASACAFPAGLRNQWCGGDYLTSYQGIWGHFIDVVLNGTEPEVTLHDGLRSAGVLDAALESRATGRLVEVKSR